MARCVCPRGAKPLMRETGPRLAHAALFNDGSAIDSTYRHARSLRSSLLSGFAPLGHTHTRTLSQLCLKINTCL